MTCMFLLQGYEDIDCIVRKYFKQKQRWKDLVTRLRRRKICNIERIYLRNSRVASSNQLKAMKRDKDYGTRKEMIKKQHEHLDSVAGIQMVNFGNGLSHTI